jgi:hypothetical protein
MDAGHTRIISAHPSTGTVERKRVSCLAHSRRRSSPMEVTKPSKPKQPATPNTRIITKGFEKSLSRIVSHQAIPQNHTNRSDPKN